MTQNHYRIEITTEQARQSVASSSELNLLSGKSNAQKAIERMNAHAMDKSLMMRDCTKSALQQSLLFGAFNYESPIDKILREQREFEERIYGTAKLTNTLRADIAKSIAIEADKKALLALVGFNPDQWLRIDARALIPPFRQIKQKSDLLLTLHKSVNKTSLLYLARLLNVLSTKTANYLRGITQRIVESMTYSLLNRLQLSSERQKIPVH